LLKGRGPEAVFADLRLALGIAIFSESTAHGYFLEDLASDLFNHSCKPLFLGLTLVP
jgi:hypothetical protein